MDGGKGKFPATTCVQDLSSVSELDSTVIVTQVNTHKISAQYIGLQLNVVPSLCRCRSVSGLSLPPCAEKLPPLQCCDYAFDPTAGARDLRSHCKRNLGTNDNDATTGCISGFPPTVGQSWTGVNSDRKGWRRIILRGKRFCTHPLDSWRRSWLKHPSC